MVRFLLLPFTLPAERLLTRVRRLRASVLPPEAHAPTSTPRLDHDGSARHGTSGGGLLRRLIPFRDDGTPNSPTRRDSMRAVVGFPLALFFLSAAAASGTTGCAASGASSLAVTEVDMFTIGHTSEDGMTLQGALVARARELGIDLAWHQSTAPDQVDAATSVEGTRLVRWDYRPGSSTDSRHYLFEVYQENGEPIGNEPELATVLHRGYSVVVLEVSSVTA